eukprot:TRINITY_DN7994_c0_g1_i6.p1 TRINITY_DN7994_c0_g1~~TRINITY_DN7994_c0_g1_i6.p1  ORF type:complete len:901 (+),score=110.75 TRINITY_DN7994_c0_g1_i6:158-2860(+)
MMEPPLPAEKFPPPPPASSSHRKSSTGTHAFGVETNGTAANCLAVGPEVAHVRNSILGTNACFSSDIQEISKRENDDDLKRMLRVTARIGVENAIMVPRTSVINFLKEEQERKQKCLTIPWIVAHSVIFTYLVIAHYKVSDMSQVEREFRTMMEGTTFEGYGGPISPNKLVVSGHKTLEDIDVIDDIYTFMQDALLGLMIRDTSAERVQDYNRVLSYNQIVGPVKFQQIRKKRRPCSSVYPDLGPFDESGDNPFLKNFYCFPPDSVDDTCFGPPGEPREGFCPDKLRAVSRRLSDAVLYANTSRQLEDSEVLTQRQRPLARRLSAAVRSAKSKRRNARPGSVSGEFFSVWFQPNQGIDVALRKLVNLKRDKFIDEQTSFVGVNMFGLNPDLGVFFNCFVNLFVVPSGEIVSFVSVVTWSAEIMSVHVLVFDVIFLILCLHLLVSCFFAFFRALVKKTVVSYAMKPWSVIDWLTAVGGIVVIVMFGMYNVELSTIKESAGQLALATPPANPTLDDIKSYTLKLVDFDDAMGRFLPFLSTCRYIMGSYMLLCLIRLFKAFEAQPRLAVVSQTLVACKTDFAHFLIVFFAVFIALCAAAMPILGHRLVNYTTFLETLIEGLQVVFGNFDYDQMAEEYPVTMFLWFFIFIILLALVIFNMVLAIIMDSYGVAKQEAGISDTIWEQVRLLYIEFRNRGYNVPRSKIIEELSNWTEDQVGRKMLLDKIPEMTPAQADSIVEKVGVYEDHEDEQTLSLSDAMRLIVKIRGQLEMVLQKILAIRRVQKICIFLNHKNQPSESKAKQQTILRAKQPTIRRLEPEAEARISSFEGHMENLETLLTKSMRSAHGFGKEFVDRLVEIEDGIRSGRDAANSTEEQKGPRVVGNTSDEDTNDLPQIPADLAGPV